jgi:UDP-N-acetylmuramyl pentapeptide synthase
MPFGRIRLFEQGPSAQEYLREQMKSGDVLLFKGSRRMKLDVIIDALFKPDTNE